MHKVLFAAILGAVPGENPDRDGLRDTPERMASAWEHWLSGYAQNPADVLKTFEDGAEQYDEMISQDDLPFWSTCEHHLAPFFGTVQLSYIPNGKIIGLSKFSRLVEIYARRLTVQERITTQIADALMKYLKPKGVGITLRARHACMESRGIQKSGTITTTTALRGAIKDHDQARTEYMMLINRAGKVHW